jgi:hypothetical protein
VYENASNSFTSDNTGTGNDERLFGIEVVVL